jgi:signal transduction histidine kinase
MVACIRRSGDHSFRVVAVPLFSPYLFPLKIRAHLLIVVLAAVLPVALFAALTTSSLWETQRDAFEQRFLERVSALRLALDTEIEATVRTLRTLSDSVDLDPQRLDPLRADFERILAHQNGWATMGVLNRDATELMRVDGWDLGERIVPDEETLDGLRRSGEPAVSDLIRGERSRVLITFVVVPVVRDKSLAGFLYVGIEHRRWLDMLRTYPIAPEATLTLNDRRGVIVARTLNDEQWAGKQSSPRYWEQTVGKHEGVFQNDGLEGQKFYTAFSRLKTSGWVLGTGVPRDQVEAALRGPTMLLALGTVLAALVAGVLAVLFARRISGAMTRLAVTAKDLVESEKTPSAGASSIAEVDAVQDALVATSRRLTEREQALRWAVEREAEARGRAEHESQAKDGFLAMLGHELRNPIAAISAATHVLGLHPSKEDDAEARRVLKRQVRHLSEVVNDLLEVARLASGRVHLTKERVDLARLTDNVVAALRTTGRTAHVEVTTEVSPAWVLGDETRLEQIANNLVDNACKYTPAGGHVHVGVAPVGDEAVLAVRDDGSGISSDLMPHLFELFTQGERTRDRSQGGLGLGLNVVRRLVQMHGGSVSAESDGANRGATFTVRLPRIADEPQACS